MRAAGDRLGRIRLLLVSAYPPHRLGRAWVDRLISAQPWPLRYLDEEAARSLVVEPIPGFPDIYPPGGVDRILAETHRQPYLVQLVCDRLTFRLNEVRRLKAEPEDLDVAFDRAFETASTQLFQDLWAERQPEEQEILRRLAKGEAAEAPRPAYRDLVFEGFLEEEGGSLRIAVPMFAEWIRDWR